MPQPLMRQVKAVLTRRRPDAEFLEETQISWIFWMRAPQILRKEFITPIGQDLTRCDCDLLGLLSVNELTAVGEEALLVGLHQQIRIRHGQYRHQRAVACRAGERDNSVM